MHLHCRLPQIPMPFSDVLLQRWQCGKGYKPGAPEPSLMQTSLCFQVLTGPRRRNLQRMQTSRLTLNGLWLSTNDDHTSPGSGIPLLSLRLSYRVLWAENHKVPWLGSALQQPQRVEAEAAAYALTAGPGPCWTVKTREGVVFIINLAIHSKKPIWK